MNDVPTKIDVPGATARQKTDFGDTTGYGTIGAEYFTLAGADRYYAAPPGSRG
jgi:hypothetical protein